MLSENKEHRPNETSQAIPPNIRTKTVAIRSPGYSSSSVTNIKPFVVGSLETEGHTERRVGGGPSCVPIGAAGDFSPTTPSSTENQRIGHVDLQIVLGEGVCVLHRLEPLRPWCRGEELPHDVVTDALHQRQRKHAIVVEDELPNGTGEDLGHRSPPATSGMVLTSKNTSSTGGRSSASTKYDTEASTSVVDSASSVAAK